MGVLARIPCVVLRLCHIDPFSFFGSNFSEVFGIRKHTTSTNLVLPGADLTNQEKDNYSNKVGIKISAIPLLMLSGNNSKFSLTIR